MRFLVYGTYWRLYLRGMVGFPISAYHKALWVRVLDSKELEISTALYFCEDSCGFVFVHERMSTVGDGLLSRRRHIINIIYQTRIFCSWAIKSVYA